MEILAFPVNALILLLLFDCIVIFHIWKRNNAVVRFLGSVKTSIVAIVLLIVVVLLMGVVPQKGTDAGFDIHKLAHSVYFFSIIFFFLITLGFAAVKRTIPFNKNNLWYIFTHWGLWLAVSALAFGSFDRQSCEINICQDIRNNVAQSSTDEDVQLPFVINISKFYIDRTSQNEISDVAADVEFFWNNEDYDFSTVRVNEPYAKNGWIVSLKKYESNPDGQQVMCVFNVLYDRWQLFVELGFALLAIGLVMFALQKVNLKKGA